MVRNDRMFSTVVAIEECFVKDFQCQTVIVHGSQCQTSYLVQWVQFKNVSVHDAQCQTI